MRLRQVEPGDVDLYVAMRCDPVVMTELGGPQPREGIAAKVARDVAEAEAGREWIYMVLPDDDDPLLVAGNVVIFPHPEDRQVSEIGWMLLPQFQGKGIAKAAARLLLKQAAQDGRWGDLHAYCGVTNAPSNGLCRSLGFTLVGEQDTTFAGRALRSNHWQIDPSATG